MPYNPNYPATNALVESAPLRAQFNALKALIDGIPAGPQGPPGEITQQQLNDAINGTSANSNAVGTLDGWEPNDPPVADDLRTLRDKINELINALRR